MNISKGKWVVDPSHSSVTFSVKHLMISKVKGNFDVFSGSAVVGDNVLESKLEADVNVASINTKDANRDAHLKSADFFDTDVYESMKFVSQKVLPTLSEHVFHVKGLLTVKDVTKPVIVEVEVSDMVIDPYGNTKVAAEAVFVIDRTSFGLTWNTALETGGVLVGNDVTVTLDIQATLEV